MQECHVFRVAAADDIQQVIQAHLLRHEYFCITVMNYLVGGLRSRAQTKYRGILMQREFA